MTGELALAAEHDAAGRHDDAINALALATQRGDLEATVALARRLLIGDRAPYLPKEAVRFLLDAVNAGSAAAAERLAPLAALGAHVEQSWGDALRLLVRAADLGSENARGQLRTLAGRGDAAPGAEHAAVAEPAFGESAPRDDWSRLAQSIDLRAWLTAPPGTTLNELPVVRQVTELASDAVCRWLKRRTEGKLRRALIYDPVQGGDVSDHMRSNSIVAFDLADLDFVQVLLQHRMAVACGLPVANAEGPTIMHYAVGEEITNHYDFVNVQMPNYDDLIKQRGERLITFLLYLNDDYEGGETDFPKVGMRHKGRRGDGLFFANALPTGGPDFRMVHAGLPPTRGEKWIVSQFFRSRVALNARAEAAG